MNPSSPKYFLSTGQKQILHGESLQLMIGKKETVVVGFYSLKVQDPLIPHRSESVTGHIMFKIHRQRKDLFILSLFPSFYSCSSHLMYWHLFEATVE
ncbi:hypothetical protein NPIL_558311 [Nephila pilipes]|uniref:Uncharacterized protein n=1 Tax=Nephila pilipes TaxID=299642 RepID=A0A8X6UU88_NEPPI|nr:hypothetical protein NPIL_558311 [Nephila pilipes]